MSNVLYLYERMMPTVALTRNAVYDMFNGTAVHCRFIQLVYVTTRDLDEADVLVLIRPQNILSVCIAIKAQKAGKFVIVSLDDDLLNLPETMPSVPWRCRSLVNSLKNADMVLSSSPHICEKYRKYTKKKRSAYLNTPVAQDELLMVPRQEIDKFPVKLVYAAGVNHNALFDQYIRPSIQKLDEKYGDKISLTFVGTSPDLSQLRTKMKINYQRGMPLEEYRAYMRAQKFDIGLAPIHDDLFSKCKYFNKYIEYTLVGTAGIYSNCEPYTFVIKDGVNGFLADNTVESWCETICRVIDNAYLRSACIAEARAHLSREFNSDAIKVKLLTDVPELIRPPVSKNSCGSILVARIAYRLLRVADVIYLTFFYLRRKGLSEVFARVQMHLSNDR